MALNVVMNVLKKNPVDKLSSNSLMVEKKRLKNHMKALMIDISKIEKEKSQLFHDGIGANWMQKKMLIEEITQLESEARNNLRDFKKFNKMYMLVSNLIVVKNYEKQLKQNNIWHKISKIGSQDFETALIKTSLVGKDFEDVLNDLSRVLEEGITDFETEEDEEKNKVFDYWNCVEAGSMDIDEVENTLSLERSLEKERERRNPRLDTVNLKFQA